MLERVRRRLTVTACASSAWLDGLFGDQLRYDEYRSTYGTVSAGALWSDYDGFDPRLRFRVRLQLPQWNERISAFAGRVGEDDYISDTEGDFDALPTRQFGDSGRRKRAGRPRLFQSLAHRQRLRCRRRRARRRAARSVRARPLRNRAHVRRQLCVPRARNRVLAATPKASAPPRASTSTARSRDTLLLRWSNLGKYTEETIGLEWFTQLTLFQSLDERTGLAWQLQTEGETDNEVPLTRHSARLILRRQLNCGLAVPRTARRRLLAAPQAHRAPRCEPRSRRRAGNAVR